MKHSNKDDKNNALPADCRTQLFNDGKSGRIEQIQVSRERIHQLRGIMFDIDPHMLRDNSFFRANQNPLRLYSEAIRPMLDRDAVLRRAKVIASGTGLQVVLEFLTPEPCDTDAARERVEAVLEAVLPVLPIDPDQPGLIATRRTVGSSNSKNGKKVQLIEKGEPIPFANIENLARQMVTTPFSTVMRILCGEQMISPCPICRNEKKTLRVLDHRGICYSSCGKIGLEQIWELVYQPRKIEGEKAVSHG